MDVGGWSGSKLGGVCAKIVIFSLIVGRACYETIRTFNRNVDRGRRLYSY